MNSKHTYYILLIILINIFFSIYFTYLLLNRYTYYRADQPQISWGEKLIIEPGQGYEETILVESDKKLTKLLIATRASGDVKAQIVVNDNKRQVGNWSIDQRYTEWGFIELKLKEQIETDELKMQIINKGKTNLNLPKTAFINNIEIPNRQIFYTPVYVSTEPLKIITSRIGNNWDINLNQYYAIIAYIIFLGNFILIYSYLLNKYLKIAQVIILTVIFWAMLIFYTNYLNIDNMANFGAYISYESR